MRAWRAHARRGVWSLIAILSGLHPRTFEELGIEVMYGPQREHVDGATGELIVRRHPKDHPAVAARSSNPNHQTSGSTWTTVAGGGSWGSPANQARRTPTSLTTSASQGRLKQRECPAGALRMKGNLHYDPTSFVWRRTSTTIFSDPFTAGAVVTNTRRYPRHLPRAGRHQGQLLAVRA